jgi:hypothetical protein
MVGFRHPDRKIPGALAETGGALVQGELVNARYRQIGKIPQADPTKEADFVGVLRFFRDESSVLA